jgi:hypothetical protein
MLNFCSSCTNGGFSKRDQLNGVSYAFSNFDYIEWVDLTIVGNELDGMRKETIMA